MKREFAVSHCGGHVGSRSQEYDEEVSQAEFAAMIETTPSESDTDEDDNEEDEVIANMLGLNPSSEEKSKS